MLLLLLYPVVLAQSWLPKIASLHSRYSAFCDADAAPHRKLWFTGLITGRNYGNCDSGLLACKEATESWRLLEYLQWGRRCPMHAKPTYYFNRGGKPHASCTWSSDSGSQLSEADSEGARGGGGVSATAFLGASMRHAKFLYDMWYDLFKGSGASSARSAFI